MTTTPRSSELTEEEKGTVGLGNPPILADPKETVLSGRGLIKTFGRVVGPRRCRRRPVSGRDPRQ